MAGHRRFRIATGVRAGSQFPGLSRHLLYLSRPILAVKHLYRSTPLKKSAAPATSQDIGRIATELKDRGFIRIETSRTRCLLGKSADASWHSFASSWDDLGTDLYMADRGRYRRRRYAAFMHAGGQCVRKPHQPHYQSRDYNPLNGDIERWFEPVLAATVEHPVTQAIFELCKSVIERTADGGPAKPWHVEFHQFRIETSPDHIGRPTPEGLHRDGVDWVFVMLVCRHNVSDGITEIGSLQHGKLGSFLLQRPGDAVLLDDRRILHGVTEIHAVDPTCLAYRDVLVVTFVR